MQNPGQRVSRTLITEFVAGIRQTPTDFPDLALVTMGVRFILFESVPQPHCQLPDRKLFLLIPSRLIIPEKSVFAFDKSCEL
jgi:hypothetical protein